MRDVVIIGKGPAGISLAIYLKRANLNPLVIGNSLGVLEKDTLIENYYGFESINGRDLVLKGIKQAESLGVEILSEEVLKIVDNYDYFTVETNDKKIDTKVVVLATGKKRNELFAKGYKNFIGKGISYCATCDGFIFRKKKIGVVGSGKYALSELEELRAFTNDLYLFTNGNEVEEKIDNVNIVNDVILEVTGSEKLEEVVLKSGEKIKIDGLFVALGVSSGLDFARHLGIDINNSNNNIIVDNNYMTNIEGVFAIGDCIGGVYQIAKAVGDGCIASKPIIDYIKKRKEV